MLIIGTNTFNVLPDTMFPSECFCNPESFYDEFERVFKSWEKEDRAMFKNLIDVLVERIEIEESGNNIEDYIKLLVRE